MRSRDRGMPRLSLECRFQPAWTRKSSQTFTDLMHSPVHQMQLDLAIAAKLVNHRPKSQIDQRLDFKRLTQRHKLFQIDRGQMWIGWGFTDYILR